MLPVRESRWSSTSFVCHCEDSFWTRATSVESQANLSESKVDGRETHRGWGAKTILSLRLTPHQSPLLFRTLAPGYSKSPLTRWSGRLALVSATVLTVPLVLVLAGWVVFSLPRWFDGTWPEASDEFLS